jgi:hypothetical protein
MTAELQYENQGPTTTRIVRSYGDTPDVNHFTR